MLRPDLIQRRVWMGDRLVWVIKDPLSGDFFYFNSQEHQILSLADGSRTVAEIADECVKRFAPQYISVASLVLFFADARKRGLLLIDRAGAPSADRSPTRARRWWHQPLAIRLPGLNPDRFLDVTVRRVRCLFSPWMLALILLAAAACLVLVASDFERFAADVSRAASRLSLGKGVVMLVSIISLAKVLHELAHAWACKYFGGECRQIGLMILVGVPCLYCDVSDAWMLDRRWKRILVSAAGMIAEVALACVATVLWWFANDGILRDLSVTVMVVCSVTTVMFNGNPLLRYDGYYILSDLVAIANLAGEASSTIRGWFRHYLWATPSPTTTPTASRRFTFVVAYGVVSGVYRMAILILILWMIYRIAEPLGFGGIVGTVALFFVVLILAKWCRSILAAPDRAVRRASMSGRRPAMIVAALIAAISVMGSIPLPRSVIAPMTVQPAGARGVFVTEAGAIIDAVKDGDDVVQGQTIATLRNFDFERKLLASRTTSQRLEIELASLRQRRSSQPELANQIPLVSQTYKDSLIQQRFAEQSVDRMTLKAPVSGRVFAPPYRRDSLLDQRQATFWEGTPLQPRNRGAVLVEGTEVCIVGHPSAREAVLFLRQQDVELVRPGQRVTVKLSDRDQGVDGRVLAVATAPTSEIPEQLRRGGLLSPTLIDLNQNPRYQVGVALERVADPLPVRLTGHAKVRVENASVFARMARFLRDTFG